MAKALVTGGTGFVGSNIALRLIERRWDVRILEGGPFEFFSGDVLDQESLISAIQGIDVLFHVDHWNQGTETMYQVNVEGTRHVMQAALQVDVERVVHTSSTAALRIHADEVVDEAFVFNVEAEHFVYGHSKHLAEEIVLEFYRKGLPVVIVTPTTAIGPRDIRKVSNGMVIEVVNHAIPP
jgi:dihydroflavonol-4-reductase